MHLLGQGSRPGPATGRTRKAVCFPGPPPHRYSAASISNARAFTVVTVPPVATRSARAVSVPPATGREVDWQDVAIRNVRYSLRTNRFDLPQARNRGQFEVAGISVWRALDRTMAGGRLEPVLRRPRPTVLLVGGWQGRRSSLVSRDRST